MNRVFLIIHAVATVAVLAICLISVSISFLYYGQELLAITYERIAVALSCGSFAATHIYLLATKRLTVQVAILFYPLCFALGFVTSFVVRGSAKGWAPASATEAAYSNLVGYSVMVVLFIACIASCYWAISRGKHGNA